ncbi:MAG TPA: TerC/Alx family metal homeostasis membrane protein [Propionibacteriaceae bacterium]|nr:TerC/Alx family metal homeostasis membrane protein [Propionibacteriaceae bacterium]
MDIHLYTWVVTIAVLVLVLAADLLILGRRPHEPSMKESTIAITFFVSLAVLFGIGVGVFAGWKYAGEFFAGYLTEYSLSVDNLFVFLIIMGAMRVPRHLQQYALMVGIILALILRGIFIAVGAAAIAQAAWVFFIFGAFLFYTAVKLVIDYRQHDDDQDQGDSRVLKWIKKVVPSTPIWHGTKSFIRIDAKRLATPMFFVIAALGSTDIMFALDSIPAIFGLTQEPYLVFTANVFALMGLRQLYFLLGGLLKKLVYLSLGLSFILGFIAVKLVLHAAHHYHWIDFEVPTSLSLGIIIGTMAVTTVASLAKSRRDEANGLAVDLLVDEHTIQDD